MPSMRGSGKFWFCQRGSSFDKVFFFWLMRGGGVGSRYHYKRAIIAGLENSTRPLVFTSVSGCRASEYFDISTEN